MTSPIPLFNPTEAAPELQRERGAPAPLTNLALAVQTLNRCAGVDPSCPRIGVFYGFSGYGKTTAATFARNMKDGIYVAAKSVWREKSLLESLAIELGITTRGRTATALLDQLIVTLNAEPRPLIIDEMDHLVRKQIAEVIRDIHDHTPSPILLVGMEELPAKLKEWEQFDNRVLVATAAQPASHEDVLALRDYYVRSVTIADDLALHIGTVCGGVTRRVVTNLFAAVDVARVEGEHSIDRAWWGDRPISTGRVPTRRRTGGLA